MSYEWKKDGGALAGGNAQTYEKVSVVFSDSGSYTVTVDTGSKAILVSPPVGVTVVAAGTLPVAGGLGVAVVAMGIALGGALAMRRRRD